RWTLASLTIFVRVKDRDDCLPVIFLWQPAVGGVLHHPDEPAVGAAAAVPSWITRRPVILGQGGPVGSREAIELVDDLAVAKGHLAGELPVAPKPRAVGIEEAIVPFLEIQHCDIGGCPH